VDLRRRAGDRARAPGGRVPALAALIRRLRALPPALRLGGLVVAVAGAFVIVAVSGSLSADKVRGWIDGFGAAGPLAFILVAAVLGSAFFPGPLLAGASGLLFGTALGTPVAVVSATLTAVLSASLARFVAGDAIAQLGGRRVTALADLAERRSFLSVLYVRLLPGVPFALFNYAVGLTRIRLVVLAGATAIGTAPRTFAYVALGGSFGDFGRPETIVAIAILVAMAVGGLVAARATGGFRSPGPGTGSSSPDDRSAGPP
jgi:uncharacterized membrane protein YdjX (TVP38/TMEM64 family)